MSEDSRRRSLRERLAGLGVGQLLATTIGLLLALATAGIGGALIANGSLEHNRGLLLDQVGPTLRAQLNLEAALVDEETGIRGYIITSQRSFLQPYTSGLARAKSAFTVIGERSGTVGPPIPAEVEQLRRSIAAWETGYAQPALNRTLPGGSRSVPASIRGKELFDEIRKSLAQLYSSVARKDTHARAALLGAANTLQVLLIIAAALVIGSVLGAGLLLQRTVTRPLARLRAAAGGASGERIAEPMPAMSGPREVSVLAAEIEQMRGRIVRELERVEDSRLKLEQQTIELSRSNAELEQFAYVASHDLQEPLRKIASFCQALQARYEGQLDDRADQYLDFAVDGAKRMQALINDLLAFSRVGRGGREHKPVALAGAVAGAADSLAASIESSGARTVVGELPVVLGDETLLRSLFQNLIGNAIKFRGDDPPIVSVSAARSGEEWLISCTDNGIGIEAEYAERIFLIFQRLHTREAFDGSGIGLALCRKIVDYHGGRIWLDTEQTGGTRFCLTLPVMMEDTP